MRRREFIVSLGGAALAWPGAATAQRPATPVIGFLGAASASAFAPQLDGFRKGLAAAGYSEGGNVAIEYRWADNQNDRLPALAAELVGRRVDMIFASGPVAAVAAKTATTITPVVFVVGTDPIEAGLVENLNRPGVNLTGMHLYIGGLIAKKLELLHELVPDVRSFAALVNPGTPSEKLDAVEIEAISRSWTVSSASVIKVGTDAEIDSVFADLAARKAAVVIGTDTFYFAHRAHIADVAAQKRVPAIHYAREFVTAGGLMSYGTNIPDIYRQAGVYAARVLKGEKPAEMPVQQPTKFEFVINLVAAKAIGLTVPASLLALADEVIE
jgi:putative tryptophan/tyrosine transport system substrate-binding protein